MKIELTKQECIWLSELAKKEKFEQNQFNKESPNALFELRRDNMAVLEDKLNMAIQKQIQNERKAAR